MAYRSTVHDSTGETPKKLKTGRQLILSMDAMAEDDPEFQFKSRHHYVQKLEQDIKQSFVRVRDTLHRVTNLTKYSPGDLVMLKCCIRSPLVGKLEDKYVGPYAVITKISDCNYRIQRSPTNKAKIVSHDRLKACYMREEVEND